MSSTFEAFTPLTETWGLLNSGRPTQRLAVATSQKVKICNLQLAPTQPHTTFETMIFEKRDSYFCSHLCSIPILNPQLALPQFHCFRSLELFHTSHVLPGNILEDKLLFFPPQVCQCRYECNLWRISSLFPWESRLPRQYLLSETIFGWYIYRSSTCYSHMFLFVDFCERNSMESHGPWPGFWRLCTGCEPI